MQVINKSMKRILCCVMVVIMTVTIIYNDYEEAEATGVEEVFLIDALLSFVASMALEKSGIVPEASEILSGFIEGDTINGEEVHSSIKNLIEKVNSGASVTDEEMEMYNVWVEGVQEFYLDLIKDMNKTGAVDEGSALSYITKLFDYEYVSDSDIKEAFQQYCVLSETVQAAGDVASFAVNSGCIGITNKLANIMGDDLSYAIDVYMEKKKNSTGESYSKEFDHSSIEFCTNLINRDLPSVDSEFIQFISSLECPYIVYSPNSTANPYAPTYYVYYRSYGNEIKVSYQASNNAIYGTFYDEGSSTSKKCDYSVFKADGSFLRSSTGNTDVAFYVGGTSYNTYDVLFWNKCNFANTLLNLLGVTYLPESHLYSLDYTSSPSADIPIDNLYEGVDVPSQPIDDAAADDEVIYYPIGGINDLADEVAALRVAIDNLETEGKTYDEVAAEIEKAIENVKEKSESKVESDVKNNINNSLSLNYLDSPGLNDKFPFCIPFDLYNLIKALDAEPVAPKFTIPIIKNEKYGWDYSITVDWSDFNVVAEICRGVEVFCFIFFLIMKTRSLIRG